MENQRIRISKKMLKDALIDLLQQKDLQKITIHELCAHAQINRTTFYKYYGNQYDVLADIQRDMFDELELRMRTDKLLDADGLSQTLAYLEEERTKCRLLFNIVNDTRFTEQLFNLDPIRERMEQILSAGFTDTQSKYLSTFLYQGGFAIIRQWINAETRESPAEMSQLIFGLMTSLIQAEA